MSSDNDSEHRNFIEAKMIIQEFHDDPTVFIVGTAPFGKLWFDHDKIEEQYKVLTDTWYEEYGENETKHSKRPRIISVLLDENDTMFNKYRDSIREAQEKMQEESNTVITNPNENVVVESSTQENVKETKKTTKKKTKITSSKKNNSDKSSSNESDTTTPAKKRGRPKKQNDIIEAFAKTTSEK